MIDPAAVERATGWTVAFHEVLRSTNDEAAHLREAGALPRTAVVAARQTHGRGRRGRAFASPVGGLYVSLLVGARPEDLPGPLTAAVALAAAEAVEAVSGLTCGIKWPNDLWIGRQKVGGILLEAADAARPVVAGLGINVREVPSDLPPAVRAATTALAPEAGRAIEGGALLETLLGRVDAVLSVLRGADGACRLEEGWRARLQLLGESVLFEVSGVQHRGTLTEISLERGLLVAAGAAPPRWVPPAHVSDLRPEV